MESSTADSSTQVSNLGVETERGWRSLVGMSDAGRFSSVLTWPAQLVLFGIIVFPLLMLTYISLTSWTPTRGGDWFQAYRFWDWGLNYVEVLGDAQFLEAVLRTFIIVGVAVPLEFVIGLGLAFLFLENFPGKRIFHSIVLTPMMIVPAVAGFMFYMIFQTNGPLNAILSIISGTDIATPWLINGTLAMAAVIIAEVWQWTPFMFLILLSGLVGMPEDQMRVATILGASFWQRFRYLMLPMLKPVIIIALVIRGMEAFKIFDVVFLMTGGGPARATETISVFMYKEAFLNIRWSFAAAASLIILVLVTIIASYALKPLQAPAAEAEGPIGQ